MGVGTPGYAVTQPLPAVGHPPQIEFGEGENWGLSDGSPDF